MEQDNDPTEYEPYDPACSAEGDDYTGDKCPNCGDCLDVYDIVYNSDANKTELRHTEASAAGENLWCEDCWEEVAESIKPEEQTFLSRFL